MGQGRGAGGLQAAAVILMKFLPHGGVVGVADGHHGAVLPQKAFPPEGGMGQGRGAGGLQVAAVILLKFLPHGGVVGVADGHHGTVLHQKALPPEGGNMREVHRKAVVAP